MPSRRQCIMHARTRTHRARRMTQLSLYFKCEIFQKGAQQLCQVEHAVLQGAGTESPCRDWQTSPPPPPPHPHPHPTPPHPCPPTPPHPPAPGGAFKFRGACNSVRQLTPEQAARGVVTHSSGNHAAALALAARMAGVPAYIVVPQDAPAIKVRGGHTAGAKPAPERARLQSNSRPQGWLPAAARLDAASPLQPAGALHPALPACTTLGTKPRSSGLPACTPQGTKPRSSAAHPACTKQA
jgi:hypothetical protein